MSAVSGRSIGSAVELRVLAGDAAETAVVGCGRAGAGVWLEASVAGLWGGARG